MNNYDLDKVKDIFSRLFVLAIKVEMNLYSFTSLLERSIFIRYIEENKYNDYFNNSVDDIFFNITGLHSFIDSYGIFNDAYWSGKMYFDLFLNLKKSFSYLFLKLPLIKMLDLYNVYHEMDFSSLVDFFMEKGKEKTILKLLCINKHSTLTIVSSNTKIPLNTLKKYSLSDDILYKGSFQNIMKIKKYFDVPTSLFLETID